MNKVEKALVGKTIKLVNNNTYYGFCTVIFTDGTTAKFKTYSTGVHNDRWEAISIEYTGGN